LDVRRVIVPVSHAQRGGKREWDTEPLFATKRRPDLVGHLEGTGHPGEPGNVVLIGHNYNRGAYNWTGVFYGIQKLRPGDSIVLMNDRDEVFRYRVEKVEKVPLRNTLQHIIHLGPTQDETLTLATCGGANFAPFPARIYVTAKRER
jgi:LPXTG-site transpeptidase (sortase) family protein